MGYHVGRVICLVANSVLAGKGIASKFKNSKVGKKIINKFRDTGKKV